MKIVYVSDLHGYSWKYEAVLELAIKEGVHVLLNGGDMFPGSDIDLYEAQATFVEKELPKYLKRLEKNKIQFISILGNGDLAGIEPLLEHVVSSHSHAAFCDQKLYELDGYEFLGLSWVIDYPSIIKDRCHLDRRSDRPKRLSTPNFALFSRPDNNYLSLTKDEYLYEFLPNTDSIEDALENLPTPKSWDKTILVTHHPPFGKGLDLDHKRRPVGSRMIKKFIDHNQPLLTCHGHIHNSFDRSNCWAAAYNKTRSIQPGQTLGMCRVVLIDLDTATLKLIGLKKEKHLEILLDKTLLSDDNYYSRCVNF